jgi:uncharacterized protein (TIGR02246 family)
MFNRKRLARALPLAGGVLILAAALAVRADDPKEPDRSEDQKAVRARAQEFLKALAKADAKEVAAFWTPTGEYMHGDDLTIRGRDNIEKAYAERVKKRPPGEVQLENDSVRFLSDDTAIQEGSFVVKRPNPADTRRNRFSALYVRVKGQWQFGLLREWPLDDSLKDLAWLVGAWTIKTDEAETRLVVEWTENKTFLIARFKLKEKDYAVTGTQILALDPGSGNIKSWSFENDGSLGQAVWTRTDKGWTAKSTGVTADGERVSATTVIEPIDDDSFTWRLTDRTIDGEKAPDVGPIKAVREAGGK